MSKTEVKVQKDEATAVAKENQAMIDAIDRVQAVISFDLDGNVLHANDNFLNTLGYTLDEIQGKHHRMFCEQDYSSSLDYKLFWKNLAAGEFATGEFKRLGKDGEAVWISASYNPVFDDAGKPVKVIKYATDITQSKVKAADDAGKITAINRAQAVIEFDLDGVILHANDNFLNTVHYSLEEIKGKHHRMFCEPELVASREYTQFWEALGRGEFHAGEFLRLAKDGSDVWINASYNPIVDADGKPVKVVKYAVDITEEKARKAIDDGKLAAIDRAQAVIEFDLQGNILSANENFLQTVGYTADEIAGQHHRIFCEASYVNSDAYRKFWETLRSGTFDQGEYKRFTKTGDEIWIQASYNPVMNAKGQPYRVVKYAVDVTESKLLAAENDGKIKAIDKAQASIEFTAEGRILTANEAFLNVTGYVLDEIVGQHHRMFCESDYTSSDEYRRFWEKLGQGTFDAGRYKRIGKGGTVVWIQATYNPIVDMNGDVMKVVKYATNITSQVEVEETVVGIANDFTESTSEITQQATTVANGAQSLGATT
ncbi:MAG: PAS domain-containing protein, partial [Granulosicoccus sp.]